MEKRIFDKYRSLVYSTSGISLGPGKEALVEARVGKRIRELNLSGHKEYLHYLDTQARDEEIVLLLDVISTNVTHFFRESAHFSLMEQVLSHWKDRGQKRFRIWCAASSTGEEPYSLAMTADSVLGGGCDIKILATDISTRVLAIAEKGIYSKKSLQDIPHKFHQKYIRTCMENRDVVEICPELKSIVSFARLNLSTPPFPMHGPFDLIFCRNVMIYFDDKVRRNLVNAMCKILKPGGLLMVGHSETITGMDNELHNIRPSVYRKGREEC